MKISSPPVPDIPATSRCGRLPTFGTRENVEIGWSACRRERKIERRASVFSGAWRTHPTAGEDALLGSTGSGWLSSSSEQLPLGMIPLLFIGYLVLGLAHTVPGAIVGRVARTIVFEVVFRGEIFGDRPRWYFRAKNRRWNMTSTGTATA